MKIGDVVIPVNGTRLTSGYSRYDCAIVANLDPFAMVSVEADMLWTCTFRPEDVRVICHADAEITDRAVNRYRYSHSGEDAARKGEENG